MIVQKIYSELKEEFSQHILTCSSRQNREKNELNDENVTIAKSYIELNSLPIAPTFVSKLWKKLSQIDMLCIHYPFPLVDFIVALYPFRLPKIIVYWHSEIVSQKYTKFIVAPFTKRLLDRADRIIVSSPESIKHSTFLSKHSSKISIIPFGVPSPEYSDINKEKHIQLLSIGRHVEYKGYKVLIETIKETNYHLTIIGKGPLLNEHKNLVRKYGIENQVRFIESANHAKLHELIEACKVLIFPSIYPSEAFGLVQIEAMSHGKPIINTSLKSGVPWVARDQKEALTVEPNNKIELLTAINRLMTDSNLYSKLASGAKNRYKNQFTEQTFLTTTYSFYKDVLSE